MNRVQVAALMGVHPDTVTDYARQGMPVEKRGGHGVEGVYDAVECLAWVRDQSGQNMMDAAKTRSLEASAALNEFKLRQAEGQVWPREQIIAEGRAFVKAWTASVRALPRRLRQLGVLHSQDQEIAAAGIIRQLLEDIAGWKTSADAERAEQEADAAA